jgi:hypothetical protein
MKARGVFSDGRAVVGDDSISNPKPPKRPKPDFIKEGEFKV